MPEIKKFQDMAPHIMYIICILYTCIYIERERPIDPIFRGWE